MLLCHVLLKEEMCPCGIVDDHHLCLSYNKSHLSRILQQ